MASVKLLAILLCGVLGFLQMITAQPPPPHSPRLSNSFTSKITILNGGSEVTSDIFINYELKKALKITNLGTKGVAKVYELIIGDTKTTYQYIEPFDYCTTNSDGGIITPMWSWLDNSSYKLGVSEFKGKLVAVWTYQNKTTSVMKEAAFSPTDYKTPVYLVSNIGDGPMIFKDYDDSTPPPESRFTIPESCKKTPLPSSPFLFSSPLDSSETLKILRTLNKNYHLTN